MREADTFETGPRGDPCDLILGVSTITSSRKEPEEVLRSALDSVCSHLRFCSSVVYRADEDCREIRAVAFHGVSERLESRLRVFPLSRWELMAQLCRGELPYITHEDGMPELGSRVAQELGLPDVRWAFVPMRVDDAVTGALGVLAPGQHPFSEDELRILDVLSYQFASVVEHGERYGDASSTCERIRQDLRASQAMLRAAEAMADKTDLAGVLEALAAVVHDVTGRAALVTLVQETRSDVTVAAAVGADSQPGRTTALSELDPVLRQSLVERRSVVIESFRTPSPLGMPSGRFLSVPLINDGTLIGSIEVDNPPTGREELSREVRVLQGIAFEAGAAIASTRLYERQRRSASLRESLNDINAMLNESIEHVGLLQSVLEAAARAIPAEQAVLAMLEDDRWIVEHVFGDVNARVGDELSAEDASNAQHAMRGGAPALRPEGLYERLQSPGEKEATRLVLVVPLTLRKQAFGAMFFRRRDWVEILDSETLDFASKLGSSVSLTLGNRYLYEHEHRVSETLQQALLSMPESVPGLRLSHLYMAAAERTRVGGDFYDVFELADGMIAIVIGDISGKGLDAAALTALAKNALKAHAIEGLPPRLVLERTNEIMYQFSSMETFATVFLGVLDPSTGEICYSNAGHMPPLIFSEQGTRALEGEGALLGAFSGARYDDFVGRMHPEDVLLLYTDGVTEARNDAGELYGEERLAHSLSELAGLDIADVPEAVVAGVEAFAPAGLSDDAAILAVGLQARE